MAVNSVLQIRYSKYMNQLLGGDKCSGAHLHKFWGSHLLGTLHCPPVPLRLGLHQTTTTISASIKTVL